MFKSACIILVSVFLMHSSPVMANDQLSEIIKGIRKRYGNLPGFAVTYSREIISRTMVMLGESQKTDLATGRIYFKPPHFLKVQQETPRPETVTTDGDILWWYIPQKGVVYRYPSHKLGKELQVLCDIFNGLRAVEESFHVVLGDMSGKGKYQLKLTPDPPWPDIDHIDITVAQGDYHILTVEIHNYIGGITRFILGDFTKKEKLEPDFFSFVAPEGVRVIEGDDS